PSRGALRASLFDSSVPGADRVRAGPSRRGTHRCSQNRLL
ncbi:uncharacterized protein METZ01_LOCUS495476, partial [marine metagenome]